MMKIFIYFSRPNRCISKNKITGEHQVILVLHSAIIVGPLIIASSYAKNRYLQGHSGLSTIRQWSRRSFERTIECLEIIPVISGVR